MKENVISAEEYDVYFIRVSPFLFGRKLNEYIETELEKIHPCFTEDSLYEIRKCIKNGRVFARVYVVEKSILTNCNVLDKNESKTIYLEKVKGKFSFNKGKSRKNIYFASLAIPLFVFICISVSGCLSLLDRNAGSDTELIKYSEDEIIGEENIFEEFILFSESVLESGGMIRSLNFNKSFFDATVIGSDANKLYFGNSESSKSEILNSDFNNGNKEIEIRFTSEIINDEDFNFDSRRLLNIFTGLEGVVPLFNGYDISEDFNNCRFGFAIEKENLNSCFLNLDNFFSENNIAVNDFNLLVDGNKALLDFRICELQYESPSLFSFLYIQNGLFDKKKNNKENYPSEVMVKNSTEKYYGVLIGKVFNSNGECIAFYKEPGGKIKGVKINESLE